MRRSVETVAFGLEDLISGDLPRFPTLNKDADGLRILSAPMSRLAGIRSRFPGYIIGGLQPYRRYYIEMQGCNYEDYLLRFSSKTRSTLNRKRRRLIDASGGALDLREFHHENQIEAFLADALPLSRRTYQSLLLNAGLPDGPDAIREMKALAHADELRAYILYLDGHAISYLYLPTSRGTVIYAHLGYDADYAHLSVGTVLQMEVLERLFNEARYRYFDFTEGDGEHKKLFGTASVAACSFLLLRPSIANWLLIGSLRAFDTSVALGKRVVSRGRALAFIRRTLRQ